MADLFGFGQDEDKGDVWSCGVVFWGSRFKMCINHLVWMWLLLFHMRYEL